MCQLCKNKKKQREEGRPEKEQKKINQAEGISAHIRDKRKKGGQKDVMMLTVLH